MGLSQKGHRPHKTVITRDTIQGTPFGDTGNASFTAGPQQRDGYSFSKSLRGSSQEAVPLQQKSLFTTYIPGGNLAIEQTMEKNWFDNMNKKVKQKREDEELRETIHDWGSAKARVQEDIGSRFERGKLASNYRNIGYKKKEPHPHRGKKKVIKNMEDFLKTESSSYSLSSLAHSEEHNDKVADLSTTAKTRMRGKTPTIEGSRRPLFFNIGHQSPEEDFSPKIRKTPYPERLPPLDGEPAPVAAAAKVTQNRRDSFDESEFDDEEEMGFIVSKASFVSKVRKIHGDIIGATKNKGNIRVLNNVFNTGASSKAITLSLYSRPNDVPARPKTGQVGVRPNQFDERVNRDNSMLLKSQEAFRQEQRLEIQNIKESLATSGLNCSIRALERAILIPSYEEDPNRKYPNPAAGLMKNPFPPVKKKKKGKKKKKK